MIADHRRARSCGSLLDLLGGLLHLLGDLLHLLGSGLGLLLGLFRHLAGGSGGGTRNLLGLLGLLGDGLDRGSDVGINLVGAVLLDEVGEVLDRAASSVVNRGLGASREQLDGGEALDLNGNIVGLGAISKKRSATRMRSLGELTVASTLAMMTLELNSLLSKYSFPSSSYLGARFLQCPHQGA